MCRFGPSAGLLDIVRDRIASDIARTGGDPGYARTHGAGFAHDTDIVGDTADINLDLQVPSLDSQDLSQDSQVPSLDLVEELLPTASAHRSSRAASSCSFSVC
jgi:hypothetical protein